jgi:hypothetical protein
MCDRMPFHIPGHCPPLHDPEADKARIKDYLAANPDVVERIRIAVESLTGAPPHDPKARAEWEQSG